jgi:hypothetical protein
MKYLWGLALDDFDESIGVFVLFVQFGGQGFQGVANTGSRLAMGM